MTDALLATGQRVIPVLVFLVAVTVLAELADESGVFDAAGRAALRLARGRTRTLFAAVVTLAVLVTTGLGLDTTAVLLTPVALTVAERAALPALPFALATLWLANTASLLLPVSNLTNLLALSATGAADAPDGAMGLGDYLRLSWAPAAAAIAVTVAYLVIGPARALPRRFAPVPPGRIEDRICFGTATAACLALGPLVVLGVAPWLAAAGTALPLLAVVAARRHHVLRRPLVPWRAVLLVSGLFTALAVVQEVGWQAGLDRLAVGGHGIGDLLGLAGLGALTSNAIDNLPAYLLLEPAAGGPERLMALLVGTNAGPLVTLWASLATILWRDRCRARGLEVPWTTLARHGLVLAPLVVILPVLALSAAVGP